jgi:hypothetical protein
VHHLDGAAGEAEGHGPEGGLAGPVGDYVQRGAVGDSVVSIRDVLRDGQEGGRAGQFLAGSVVSRDW